MKQNELLGRLSVLITESDGGTDHATYTTRGRFADLLVIFICDVDAVFHTCSAAGWSFTNAAEHMMSQYNEALYGTAIARTEIDAICEDWVRNLGTAKELRAACDKHPKLKPAKLNLVSSISERCSKSASLNCLSKGFHLDL